MMTLSGNFALQEMTDVSKNAPFPLFFYSLKKNGPQNKQKFVRKKKKRKKIVAPPPSKKKLWDALQFFLTAKKILSMLLSASVERFSVSYMRDFVAALSSSSSLVVRWLVRPSVIFVTLR